VSTEIDLGRFANAHRLAETSPPLLRERFHFLVADTRLMFADASEAATVQQYWSARLLDLETESRMHQSAAWGVPAHIDFLIRAGLFDEARKAGVWARPLLAAGQPTFRSDTEGELALIEGRRDEALRLLQEARAAGAPIPHDLRLAYTIAEIQRSRGKNVDAVRVLEAASEGRWPQCPTPWVSHSPCIPQWLRVRDLLSQLYREAGRFDESRAVDAQLSTLLAAADADHPVRRRLQARQAAR
jgi:hypothetical protein